MATGRAAKPNPGLYTSKFIHKDLHKDLGYCSIGDKYIDAAKRGTVNARFKGKQFTTRPVIDMHGKGQVGYFMPHSYSPSKYADSGGYLQKEPLDKRKLGFGSHDAKRRDEFMNFIRTEQYRQQLKSEKGANDKATVAAGKQLLAAGLATPEKKGFPEGLMEVQHLYDVGRNLHTDFDQKSSRDQFYNAVRSAKSGSPRRLGGVMLSSMAVGDGIHKDNIQSPSNGHKHATQAFFDKSHLTIG